MDAIESALREGAEPGASDLWRVPQRVPSQSASSMKDDLFQTTVSRAVNRRSFARTDETIPLCLEIATSLDRHRRGLLLGGVTIALRRTSEESPPTS